MIVVKINIKQEKKRVVDLFMRNLIKIEKIKNLNMKLLNTILLLLNILPNICLKMIIRSRKGINMLQRKRKGRVQH
jgi:hypothetical protein